MCQALAGEFDLYIIFCESQHISDLTIRELSSQSRFGELLEVRMLLPGDVPHVH